MRKLLTHYQLAELTENRLKNRNVSPLVRERIAQKILDEISDLDNETRSNVLTNHLWNVKETQNLNLGNALRRQAQKYLGKRY